MGPPLSKSWIPHALTSYQKKKKIQLGQQRCFCFPPGPPRHPGPGALAPPAPPPSHRAWMLELGGGYPHAPSQGGGHPMQGCWNREGATPTLVPTHCWNKEGPSPHPQARDVGAGPGPRASPTAPKVANIDNDMQHPHAALARNWHACRRHGQAWVTAVNWY